MDKLQRSKEVEDVLRQYANCIYRIALVRVKNVSDAEDIIQEVFLKYMKCQLQFEDEEHRKAWFIRVTINQSLSFLRLAWNRKRTAMPEDKIGENMPENMVYQEVLALPEEARTMVHLYYYEEYSIKEIAKLLKKSESAVKTGLHRARTSLKEMLEE